MDEPLQRTVIAHTPAQEHEGGDQGIRVRRPQALEIQIEIGVLGSLLKSLLNDLCDGSDVQPALRPDDRHEADLCILVLRQEMELQERIHFGIDRMLKPLRLSRRAARKHLLLKRPGESLVAAQFCEELL